jgi:uncharacterized protein
MDRELRFEVRGNVKPNMRLAPLPLVVFLSSLVAIAPAAAVSGTGASIVQTPVRDPTVAITGVTVVDVRNGRPDTLRVGAPTGQPDIDRPRVQEVFDRARPGDTVQFAAGTYVLGEGARLTVPDVTVIGHPDGTTIKGCEPDRFDIPEGPLMENLFPIVMGCTGLFVFADRQTIRGLTFEHAWHGLLIGYPPWLEMPAGETAPDTSFGGHRIEHNVFRNVPNGIRVIGPSSEVTLIRENEVVNAYHAFLAEGATVHIIDNWITVPEPDSVPAAHHPESGVIVNPGLAMGRCVGSHVVGNVIDGTVNGIQVLAAGGRSCAGHEIRDNVVRVRRVPLRPGYPRHLLNVYFGEEAEGTAVTGTAIRLVADSSATVTDVLIRNNRVLGGHGLGIQLERASGNRIAGNYISRIQGRIPFPGLTWGDDPERWRAANGSAVWISEGSANNVVEDNTFSDIEGPAIHLDGDDNEVRLNGGEPAVRDEGRGNRVLTDSPGRDMGQVVVTVLLHASAGQAQPPPPILDMHLHASSVSEGDEGGLPVAICAPFDERQAWDPGQQSYEEFFTHLYLEGRACDDPVWSAESDEELMRQTIEIVNRRNMYGVLSGEPGRVDEWREAAPGRFIPALYFNVGVDTAITPDSLRQLVVARKVEVLGEIWNWYDGIAPDDPRMEPYWMLAEELDIPVAIHLNGGRPGEPHAGYGARGALVSALTMEEVLVRHPRLRIYLMHAGYPLLDDLLVVLHSHPQVYVDVGSIVFAEPRAAFYHYLQRIVEAGFANRVMFGSDQVIWPDVIERAIASIEAAPFLTEQHKRDILYNNAARFLRLSDEEIARHHGS